MRVVGSGILASLFLAGHDFWRLHPVEPEDFEASAILLRRLIIVGGAMGASWGFVTICLPWLQRLGRSLGKRPNLLPASLITMAAIPYLLMLSTDLLSGAGVQRMIGHPLMVIFLPIGLFSLALAFVYWSLRLLDWHNAAGKKGRWLVVGLVTFAAVAVFLVDLEYRRGHYLFLHDSLAFVALSLAIFAVAAMGSATKRLGFVRCLFLVLGVLAVMGDLSEIPSVHQRSILFRRTLQGRRILGLWRALGSDQLSLYDDLAIDADFQAERRQIHIRLDDARVELVARLGAQPVKNVLWLTIDTARADHFSLYGYEKPTTPTLERLGARSSVFERHYAQFPITSFSFQSTFFSRYPSATPLFRRTKRLPDNFAGNVSLAQQLSDHGVRTISFPAIDPGSLERPPYEALGLGFEEINPGAPLRRTRDAEDQVKWASKRLENLSGERFFMWVHFMDPHYDYVLHKDHNFGTGAADRYDSEIAFVDQAIAGLLDKLESLGLADSTAIVVNADHGEALGEHDSQFHGTTLYDEQLHVPCIVYVPGLEPQRITSLSNNIDLMPTVLNLMAIKGETPMQGQTLVGYLMDGDASPVRPLSFAFAEIPDAVPEMAPANTNKQMIINGRFKLLFNQGHGFVELFDLQTDPKETKNISDREPAVRDRLLSMIKSLQQEGRNLNLPSGAQSEEEAFAALRVALRGGTVPARCNLLAANLRRKQPAMAEIAMDRINDPQEHFLVKMMILQEGGELLGDRLLPYMRDVLTSPPALGAAALVLDLWLERHFDLNPKDRELVYANMQRHPHVGWRAARLLAAFGDERAKLHLIPALNLGDRSTAFASACGLGLIEDGAGAKRILDDLVFYSLDARRCGEAIRALAKLTDRRALPHITEFVRNRYQHYKVKLAALDYFLMCGGEDGISGLLYLSSGWDPDVDKEVFSRMSEKWGEKRAVAIRRAGRLVSGVDDLLRQDRQAEVLEAVTTIIEAAGGVRQAAPFVIIAARSAQRLGLADKAAVLLRELADSKAPLVYRRVAAALRKDRPGAPYHLAILDVQSVETGPLPAGLERRFFLRLRNTGDVVIPGGEDTASLGVAIAFAGKFKPDEVAMPSFSIPIWGLLPGEEVKVSVVGIVPSPGQTYQLGAKIFRRDRGPLKIENRQERRSLIRVTGAKEGGIQPKNLVFKGKSLIRDWLPSRAFNSPVMNPDESVAYLGIQLDPQIISPLFTVGSRPLRVTVDFDNEAHPDQPEELFEVYYRYPGQIHFVAHQSNAVSFKLDGSRRKLSFDIPLQNGKSAVQVRLDPFSVPHLITIHEVTVAERK